MTQDGPPTRPHLRPVNDEPPYDPEYDARRPPQDHAAEQAVLGALMHRPDLAPDLALELTGTDFYRPEHEIIWHALHILADQLHGGAAEAEHVAADFVLLSSHLERTGELTRVGGAPYLHDLQAAVPVVANVHHYAKIVRDKARARIAIETGTRLITLGYKAGDPATLDLALGDAMEAIDQAALRFGPATASTAAGLKDLSWLLGGVPPQIPPPTYGRREDGTSLFYAGKVNGIFGDPEAAKTWLAQKAIVEALNDGDRASMIDVDHNGPDHTAARLILLGARMEHLADPDRFRYYEPEDGEELTTAVNELIAFTPQVLVIDSLGEIFPMLGVSTNDSDEMTNAMRIVCSRPALTGACVIAIDHLPKSADARATGFAIGSIAKKRMIRGSYLRAEARMKPVPGGIGKVTLTIEKDTSGELRRSSEGGYAGTMTLDSTNPAFSTLTVARETVPKNDDGTSRRTQLMERISRYVEDNDQASFNEINDAAASKREWVKDAIEVLVAEGFLSRIRGARNAWIHHSIAQYRQSEDDHVQQPN